MSAIEYVTKWIPWITAMVMSGGIVTIVYFSIMKMGYFDESDGYNRKILTTLKAMIIILSLAGTIEVLKRYFVT